MTQLICKPLYPSLMHPTFPDFHHNFYPIYLSTRTKYNKRKLNHQKRLIPTNSPRHATKGMKKPL